MTASHCPVTRILNYVSPLFRNLFCLGSILRPRITGAQPLLAQDAAFGMRAAAR
jgi:hypothetical protein